MAAHFLTLRQITRVWWGCDRRLFQANPM